MSHNSKRCIVCKNTTYEDKDLDLKFMGVNTAFEIPVCTNCHEGNRKEFEKRMKIIKYTLESVHEISDEDLREEEILSTVSKIGKNLNKIKKQSVEDGIVERILKQKNEEK